MLKKIIYSSLSRKIYETLKKSNFFGKRLEIFALSLSLNYVKNVKKELDKEGPTLCSAKWLQSTIHLGIAQTHSCHHPLRHFISLDQIKKDPTALHNTQQKIQARKEMIEGKRPTECEYCWKVEDSSQLSDRHYKSSEAWARNIIPNLKDPDLVKNVLPTYLELSFSSKCNLKCSYCDPMISSSIRKEIEKEGAYPTKENFQNLNQYLEMKSIMGQNQKILKDSFWLWWEELRHKLIHLRITGGEPLLDNQLFVLLEKLKQQSHSQLNFSVNSNLMVGEVLLRKLIRRVNQLMDNESIKSFTLYTSIDTWGEHAEYLRFGLKIIQFKKNINFLLKERPQLCLTFLVTYQVLSPFKFNDFLNYILELRKNNPDAKIKVGISKLDHPQFMSAKVLPLKYRHKILENLTFMKINAISMENRFGFSPAEIQKLERIYDYVQSDLNKEEMAFNLGQLKIFYQEYDRRKGLIFGEIFNGVDL
jgi:organic radical activating enzyme